MKKILLCILTFLLSITTINAEVITEFSFIINENNKMFAYGTVNDISGYYMLDTGAGVMTLFDPVQNLPEVAVEDNTIWMLGEVFEASRHIVSSIQLGDAVLEGEFQVVQPPEELRSTFSPEIKGILNITVFTNYFVEIAFSEKKIKLHDTMPAEYEHYYSFEMAYLAPFITIPINNTDYQFLIDTGDSFTIRFPEKILTDVNEKDMFEVAVEGNFYNHYFVFKKNSFSLFGHTYYNAIFQTSIFRERGPEGSIGFDMLKNYDMVFDFTANKLYYKPLWPDYLYNILFSHTATASGLIYVNYRSNGLVIEEIVIDSPMWKKGLRPGSIVTKINSYDCVGISRGYLARILQSNDRIRIEYIDSENRSRTVRVRPKTLID